MKVIQEGKLEFRFGNRWKQAQQYDGTPEFNQGIHRFQGRSAVDFVGNYRDAAIVFFEIKDPRPGVAPFQAKMVGNKLLESMGKKMADSTFGMVLADRLPNCSQPWRPLVRGMIRKSVQVHFVLWLEDSTLRRSLRWQADMSFFQRRLRQLFGKLPVMCSVVNSTNYATVLKDLAIVDSYSPPSAPAS